jgi:hypothetical protein
MRRRGSKRRPAVEGDEEFIAWNRCGRVTTRVVKGKPVKKAFLTLKVSKYMRANDKIGEAYG